MKEVFVTMLAGIIFFGILVCTWRVLAWSVGIIAQYPLMVIMLCIVLLMAIFKLS